MKLNKDMNILIVGLGLLGGSYAEGLKKQGFKVSAITKEQSSVDFALEKGIKTASRPQPSSVYLPSAVNFL